MYSKLAIGALCSTLASISLTLQGCGGSSDGPDTPSTDKVKVTIWGESGDVKSQEFVSRQLATTIMALDVEKIMDLDWYHFGNAYYITNKSVCGGNATTYSWKDFAWYNEADRKCFNTKCGNESAPSGCFPVGAPVNGSLGGPVCQHGAAECAVNLLQMCGKSVISDWTKYTPFAVCLESKYATIESSVTSGLDPNMSVINLTVEECANQTHFGRDKVTLGSDAVIECFTNSTTNSALQIEAAKATPPHPDVPFVQVTNKTGSFVLDLSNTTLLQAICAAWQYNGGVLGAVKGCADVAPPELMSVVV